MKTNERGSVLPIGIGVISISVVFALFLVELIGCQYQTMQAKQTADALVIQVGSDLLRDGIPPVMNLDYRPTVSETLRSTSRHLGIEVTDLTVSSPDGKTIEATVCIAWKSITGLTLGNFGKLCATSNARAI